MPIVDFKCSKCGHVEEVIIGATVAEKPSAVCPACGGTMEQQFSAQGQSFDVIGGYSYQYGKKSYVHQSPEQRAKYLTPDASGKYKNPY
jgi:putative FmdB family regulatory protein